MKKLKTYITESKNTHMEHIEDLVFLEGVEGTKTAIAFLHDLKNMLSSNTNQKLNATVKWDGAPAIFCGIDPRDKKFFVAKKGIFNATPKVYKTPADVDADTSGDLATKLKIALAEFSKLGIRSGVYQGDLMFTKADLRDEVIDGEKYVVFHPNTIAYAIPANSALAKKVKAARIGIVWHTSYAGASFETMRASFGTSIISKMKKTPSVWMDDATYQDYSGTATFTKHESDQLSALIANIEKKFASIDHKVIDAIHGDKAIRDQVQIYNNTKVRAGAKITNTTQHVQGLFHYIHDKFQKEIDKLKTEKGKAGKEAKRKEVLSFFTKHDASSIAAVFDLTNMIVDAKNMIVNKMNTAGGMKTLIKTTSGYRVTGQEGFVAIDHISGNAVKLVDRLEFSRSNFSPDVIKGWQR